MNHSSRILVVAALLAVAVALVGCDKNVTKPLVRANADSLVILPDSATVLVGGTFRFTVLAYDSLGNLIDPQLGFHSTNPAVFTVDASARVTGVNEGVALLVVTSGTASDTATVAVIAADRGWLPQSAGVTANLNGVFFLHDGFNGWAVGDNGTVLHTNSGGESWALQSSGTLQSLRSVYFTSDQEGWAVGRNGVIVHTTNAGQHWTATANSGTSQHLNSVWFATPDTGWAVGAGGVVLRTGNHGVSWQLSTPTASELTGVSFVGTRDGWAVGDAGIILGTHDGGLSWFTVVPNVALTGLRGVARPSIRRANAVGAAGAAPRTVAAADSANWLVGNVGSDYDLYAVNFPSEDVGYAVGANGGGAILRTADGGQTWSAQGGHTALRLNGVFFVNDTRGWVVGQSGTILRTLSGGQP
jgi:photosystem II stability/assembly factor-like uncharacterized protein